MAFVSWTIIIVGFLFIFEIPQKIYYALKKHGNKVEEVKNNGADCYHGNDD